MTALQRVWDVYVPMAGIAFIFLMQFFFICICTPIFIGFCLALIGVPAEWGTRGMIIAFFGGLLFFFEGVRDEWNSSLQD